MPIKSKGERERLVTEHTSEVLESGPKQEQNRMTYWISRMRSAA